MKGSYCKPGGRMATPKAGATPSGKPSVSNRKSGEFSVATGGASCGSLPKRGEYVQHSAGKK